MKQYDRVWVSVVGCEKNMAGCEQIWQGRVSVVGCEKKWLVVAGSDKLWQGVGGCGRG